MSLDDFSIACSVFADIIIRYQDYCAEMYYNNGISRKTGEEIKRHAA